MTTHGFEYELGAFGFYNPDISFSASSSLFVPGPSQLLGPGFVSVQAWKGGSERGSGGMSGRGGHKDSPWEAMHPWYVYTLQACAALKRHGDSPVSNLVFTQILAKNYC